MIGQLLGQLVANNERIERYRTLAIKRATARRGRTARRTAPASAFHELRRLLEERAFYPPHKPRQASAQYRAVHDKLVKAYGCRICGVTSKTLKSRAKRADLSLNPFGAKQLETHHCVIEWSLGNGIDPDKFNQTLLPELQKAHGTNKYPRPLSAKQVKAWIDHSEDNLWVLCDVHHRAKYFGIHQITDPIWASQNLLREEFIADVRAAIAKRPSKRGTRPRHNGRRT